MDSIQISELFHLQIYSNRKQNSLKILLNFSKTSKMRIEIIFPINFQKNDYI